MLYKMIYFSSHKFASSNLRFFTILRTFSSITQKTCVQIKNKVHHVNQLKEPDLMMYTHMPFSKKTTPLHPTHSTHSTYLFKIFFSLLTLSTAFLQKACGPGKNTKELIVLFHNSKGYDNSYIIDIFSKIENIQINCLAQNQDRFKMLSFKIPNRKYKIKITNSLSFLQSNLDELSKELEDKLKSVTKNHFQDKFELVNKKLENFPYMYVNPDDLENINLPEKKYFINILTMKDISDKEYDNVKDFYEKMKFKNIKEYLECYLISDITLLADNFNNFRKIISERFELDCCKYVSAPSLTKDAALKYSKCKIENIKDVSIFNFIRKTIMGGLSDSIIPYVKLDNETIAYNDISSQYSNELRKTLPYKNYKFVETFVETFVENKYGQDKDYRCFMLCEVETTDKIRNDPLYGQCPMLASKFFFISKLK